MTYAQKWFCLTMILGTGFIWFLAWSSHHWDTPLTPQQAKVKLYEHCVWASDSKDASPCEQILSWN